MGTYPFDYDYSASVSDLHNKAVGIAFDVENHPVVRQEIGRLITPFNVMWCLPCFPSNLITPCIQLPTDIGVMLLEAFEQGQVQYAHLENGSIPNSDAYMIVPILGTVNNSSGICIGWFQIIENYVIT